MNKEDIYRYINKYFFVNKIFALQVYIYTYINSLLSSIIQGLTDPVCFSRVIPIQVEEKKFFN